MVSSHNDASDLAHRLARNAEAVCRYYLSNGRRQGCYWLVGDVHNTPGRSLFVRLTGAKSGKGAAGKWTDSAEGTQRFGIVLRLGKQAAPRINSRPSQPWRIPVWRRAHPQSRTLSPDDPQQQCRQTRMCRRAHWRAELMHGRAGAQKGRKCSGDSGVSGREHNKNIESTTRLESRVGFCAAVS
jgi:hypothetical protein